MVGRVVGRVVGRASGRVAGWLGGWVAGLLGAAAHQFGEGVELNTPGEAGSALALLPWRTA